MKSPAKLQTAPGHSVNTLNRTAPLLFSISSLVRRAVSSYKPTPGSDAVRSNCFPLFRIGSKLPVRQNKTSAGGTIQIFPDRDPSRDPP